MNKKIQYSIHGELIGGCIHSSPISRKVVSRLLRHKTGIENWCGSAAKKIYLSTRTSTHLPKGYTYTGIYITLQFI